MLYRRYGRTELDIPVFSTGGMRYQQTWSEHEPELEKAAQENLELTILRSLELGFKHIETARIYGSSEYQLGKVLSKFPREDYILQTKGTPKADVDEFKANLDDSFRRLQTDRLDLFGVHGINLPEHLELTLKPGGCMEVLREYQKQGKIGSIGFSTHGSTELITKAIQSNEFDYVNLHYYYIHQNNWSCVQEAKKRDMGVFIISPSDKGGKLYSPPAKLVELTAPFSPMVFNDLYCLSHPEVHTLSLGASRPSDFDEHCKTFDVLKSNDFSEVKKIEARLDQVRYDTCGEDFIKGYQEQLPSYEDVPGEINLEVSVRLWTLAKSFDLIDYGLMRYNLMGNADHWFPGNKVDPNLLPKVEDALKGHPFQKKLLEILEEIPELFKGEEQKRLSQS